MLGGLDFPTPLMGPVLKKTEEKVEPMERALTGDSAKDSKGGSSLGEPGSMIQTLKAWEGSRLKMVGLDALPTCKGVVTLLLGPVEDTEYYVQGHCRQNQGLDTVYWRVYEHKGEPIGVHLVLSIDSLSVMALEKVGWQLFSGMGQVIFSLLGAKPE